MKNIAKILLVWLAIACTCADETQATTEVRKMMLAQVDAWNHGDIDTFMGSYWKSDNIRFAGGDKFKMGWQATLDGYRAHYPDAATMGKLDFNLVEVRELSPTVVYVFGKWHLARIKEAEENAPHGLFTLIVEYKDKQWVITRDHTSSAGG